MRTLTQYKSRQKRDAQYVEGLEPLTINTPGFFTWRVHTYILYSIPEAIGEGVIEGSVQNGFPHYCFPNGQ